MKVLVIGTHPDDEVLGCGGTLLRLKDEGHEVHWLLVTAMGEGDFPPAARQQQADQVEAAAKAFGYHGFTWLRLPALRLDTLPLADLVQALHAHLSGLQPQWVFIPHLGDAHSDHRIVAQAAHSATKSFYMKALGIQRVLACEIPSETDAAPPLPGQAFLPTLTVDISATLERKLARFADYPTEVHPEPGPRSPSAIRALARSRGAACGLPYAEAFMLIRELL